MAQNSSGGVQMPVDWSAEVQVLQEGGAGSAPGAASDPAAVPARQGSLSPYYHISYDELRGDDFPNAAGGREEMDLKNPLTQEEMANPMSNAEVYQGSMKGLLARNIGYYVVATFQMGTQGTVSVPGVLHTVGNDYIVLYQPENGRYVTGDFYALKFVDFHETQSIPRRYF